MKSKLLLALLLLFVGRYASAHLISSTHISTTNFSTDNVAGMAMDASGNTYVLQNLYYDYTPNISYSIAGWSGLTTLPTNGHAVMEVDKIPAGGGTPVMYGYIVIGGSAYQSSITGSAICIGSNGKVYVTGSFEGVINLVTGPHNPPTSIQSSNSGSSDVFICSFDATGNIDGFAKQGGNGAEYATCISHYGTTLYVGGYYTIHNSTSESTVFNNGGAITAPAISIFGQNNSFILQFDQSLSCLQAYGWATLPNNSSSVTPKGIAVNSSAAFLTGEFTGSVTMGSSLSNGSIPLMFTSRVVTSTRTFSWAIPEGVAISTYSGHSSGNAISIFNSGYLLVCGSITYNGSMPDYSGDADAVLLRYSNINTASLPTKNWEVRSGGNYADEVNAIAYDGSAYYITGRTKVSGTGSYTYRTTSGSPITFTGMPSKQQGFIARYSIGGVLDWLKYGQSTAINGTAVASNQKCFIAFGGIFNPFATYDDGLTMGSSSPVTNHLYANLIATKDLTVVPTSNPYTLNNGSTVACSVTGATTYNWFYFPVLGGVSVNISSPTSSSTNVTLVSGGYPGSYFNLYAEGFYTQGSQACTTFVSRTITQNTYKADETTSINTVNSDASLLTLNTFPNPISGELNINYSLSSSIKATLRIFDINGRIVFEKEMLSQTGNERMPTNEWAKGEYIVSLIQDGQILASKSVIKQ